MALSGEVHTRDELRAEEKKKAEKVELEHVALLVLQDRHKPQIAEWHKSSNSDIWKGALRTAKQILRFVRQS